MDTPVNPIDDDARNTLLQTARDTLLSGLLWVAGLLALGGVSASVLALILLSIPGALLGLLVVFLFSLLG